MKNHHRVLEEIKRLESMIPSGFLGIGDEWDFKKIWAQINTTQTAFNGSRFPTREEHQVAWQNFRNLVSKVKEKQDENRKQSAELRDKIVRKAEQIPPSDDRWMEFFLAVGTMGLSEVIRAIFPLSDSRKEALQNANRELKDLWKFFTSEKSNLLRNDKDTIYQALKSAESQLQEAWDEWKKVQEEQSAELRDKIIGMAERAVPSAWEEVIGTVGAAAITQGASLILEAFRDEEAELKWRSEKLREAWKFFTSEKSSLLRQHKEEAYDALKKAQDRLDGTWTEHKGAKKKTMDNYYEAKRERHESWRKKVEQNLENNRQRREKFEGVLKHKRQNLENSQQRCERLEGVLEHKRQHLDKLNEDLNDARSNSYRERVEGWIEEELNSIQEIEGKLEDINNWIEDDSASIQEIEGKLEDINNWIEEDLSKLNN